MFDTISIGTLDGKIMIDMNNLSVGYFPNHAPEIGVYPPPVPDPLVTSFTAQELKTIS